MKRLQGLVSLALAILMFAVAYHLFWEYIVWAGFPDGYLSELDGARKIMATYFSWFSIFMALAFLFLAWRSFRSNISKPLLMACGIFLCAAAGMIALDLHYRTYMMDSRGG